MNAFEVHEIKFGYDVTKGAHSQQSSTSLSVSSPTSLNQGHTAGMESQSSSVTHQKKQFVFSCDHTRDVTGRDENFGTLGRDKDLKSGNFFPLGFIKDKSSGHRDGTRRDGTRFFRPVTSLDHTPVSFYWKRHIEINLVCKN